MWKVVKMKLKGLSKVTKKRKNQNNEEINFLNKRKNIRSIKWAIRKEGDKQKDINWSLKKLTKQNENVKYKETHK